MAMSWGGSASGLFFFRRFLAHPGRVATVFPSSSALSRMIAEQIGRAEDEYVVELGAGTGPITGAILASGVPAEKLISVEIDKEMAQFLRASYPDVTVLDCSALELQRHLPPQAVGRVGCVMCAIPIALLPLDEQQRLTEIMLSLMSPGRPFLVLTYRLFSPIPVKKLGLAGRRVAFTLRNLPPASVWAYVRDADAAALGL